MRGGDPMRRPTRWTLARAFTFVLILFAGLLLIRFAFASRHPPLAPSAAPPSPETASTSEAKVLWVIDGDTIEVEYQGRVEKVRYIGVNTPETRHPTKGVEYYGKEAKAANKRLVEGKTVRLELDVQVRDKYGRLLAYVFLPDGTFVNAWLVEQGYAQVMTIPPNMKYQDLFLKLQREAREAGRGLWAPVPREPIEPKPQGKSVPPQGPWTCPTTHPIKGNLTTRTGECIYHVPSGAFYSKTKPELCFATEQEAQEAGCRRSKR